MSFFWFSLVGYRKVGSSRCESSRRVMRGAWLAWGPPRSQGHRPLASRPTAAEQPALPAQPIRAKIQPVPFSARQPPPPDKQVVSWTHCSLAWYPSDPKFSAWEIRLSVEYLKRHSRTISGKQVSAAILPCVLNAYLDVLLQFPQHTMNQEE